MALNEPDLCAETDPLSVPCGYFFFFFVHFHFLHFLIFLCQDKKKKNPRNREEQNNNVVNIHICRMCLSLPCHLLLSTTSGTTTEAHKDSLSCFL